MIIAAMLGALTFGACVDNNESASVEAVRNAKAEELKAQAALLNAEAQAKVILANAEAALKASQAAINQAEAAIKEAQARLAEAQAEAKEIENEGALAELQAKIAEYEAEIAYQQMLKAQYVAQMEQDAIKAEEELLAAKLNLIAQERAFNEKLESLAKQDAQKLRNLYHDYVTESAKLTRAIGKVNQLKNTIAQAEAGIIKAEELAAATILDIEEDITTWETEIAAYQAVLDVYMEAHADEILSDEEVIKLTNEAYVELAKLVEAQGVAGDALAAAQKAVTEASKPVAALAKDKEAPYQVMVAAKNAYEFAITALIQAAELEMKDDTSDATGLEGAPSAWGYYSDDNASGVNSVFNTVIDVTEYFFAANTDKEDEVYNGTYEYGLYLLNKTNLDALVALKKDAKYSEKALEKLTKAVATAKESATAADSALTAAKKAVTDTEAAAEKAQADYDAALAALNAAEKARKDAEKAIDDKIAELEKAKKAAYDKIAPAEAAVTKAQADYDAAEAAFNANPTTANQTKLAKAELDLLKAKIALGDANDANVKAWEAWKEIFDKREALVKDAIQKACSDADYKKLDEANKKAWAAKNDAIEAAEKAVVALGEAMEYDESGNGDINAWLDSQVIGKDKKGNNIYSAYAALYLAKKNLAAAEAKLEAAQKGSANFDKAVAEALAEVEATEDAFEAAVKAYNEAFEAADKGVVAAKAVKKEAQDAYDAAAKAVAEMRTYISTITKYNVSHKNCASAIAALESAIAALEKNIENAEAKIETVKAKTDNFEAQIAAAEAQMEQAELLVEVETIYAEAAKAALDAALAEYAQSGETEE